MTLLKRICSQKVQAVFSPEDLPQRRLPFYVYNKDGENVYACIGISVYIMYRQRNKSIPVNIKEWTYILKEEGGWYNFIFID